MKLDDKSLSDLQGGDDPMQVIQAYLGDYGDPYFVDNLSPLCVMGGEPDEDCDPQYAMLSANASNGQLHVKTEVAFDEKVFVHESRDGFSIHLRTGQLDALIDMNSGEICWMMAGE